ncbi:MAG: hypothetical protein ACTSRE_14670, partial [Promethearchaeota archaeon]
KLNEELDAAIPGALLQIRDGFLHAAADLIKFEAIPEAMLGLKSELETQIPYLLNGSVTAQTINGTITALAGSVGLATAKNMFFNDPAWSTNTGGIFPINSISEVMGQPLGFTTDAQDYILNGNGQYPGIVTDLVSGSGVFAFLQFYDVSAGSYLRKSTISGRFNNCTNLFSYAMGKCNLSSNWYCTPNWWWNNCMGIRR